MSVLPATSASVHHLLSFYQQHLTYYRKWAIMHRFGYWGLLWVLIAVGVSIATCLLLHLDPTIIAALSLLLNAVLIAAKFIDTESKWARYRTVEIRLGFAMQAMWAQVSHRTAQGEDHETALLSALADLHPKVESLVLEEFGDFFAKVKSLQEIDAELVARTGSA